MRTVRSHRARRAPKHAHRKVGRGRRNLIATAGIAALGIVGSAFQAGTPAHGSSLETVGPITLTADSIVRDAVTPITKLIASRGHVRSLRGPHGDRSGRLRTAADAA